MINKLIYLVIVLVPVLVSGCGDKLFYFPNSSVYSTPLKYNLVYEEVFFYSADKTRLSGWFIPAVGKALGTVIHFHGNAQNISAHYEFSIWLPKRGFNLFIFDYRGYGKSEGKPGRRGLYLDSVAAVNYIQSREDINKNRIFILGQSLGGAAAIAVTGREKFNGIKAVAIESTFYSYKSIMREKIGYIPILKILKWPLSAVLVSNRYSPYRSIDDISPVPLLLIHGSGDRVIDESHTHRLFQKAKEPKKKWIIENGQHTEAFSRFAGTYHDKLVEFFMESANDN